MFNSLPQKQKNEIKKEYNIRRMVVVFGFLIFMGGTFLVFLFPSWIISFYKEKQVSAEILKDTQPGLSADVKEVATNIKRINLELRTLDTALNYKKAVPIITSIISKKTSAISLKELNYDSSANTVFLEGVSATRTSLLSFVKKLEETKLFKSVNLPISNFAKDKNINFSINLVLEQ